MQKFFHAAGIIPDCCPLHGRSAEIVSMLLEQFQIADYYMEVCRNCFQGVGIISDFYLVLYQAQLHALTSLFAAIYCILDGSHVCVWIWMFFIS